MGASTSVPIVALEPRLKAAIFLAGGLDADIPVPPEADPVNFLPRITIPVLDIGGRDDFYFRKWQDRFFALLGTPAERKRHVRVENAGHVPPRVDVIREVLAWLDRYLGPAPRQPGG
jgi:pimeloyl-ACP methyl ester carboxylesterase